MPDPPQPEAPRTPPPRLSCDRMLLRLARWLRFLGYDVITPPGDDDAELIRESREAGALLLTRDKGIMARKAVDALYVESDELEKQLWQVVGALGMPGGGEVMSRCSLCNTPLDKAGRDDLAGAELAEEVPLKVLEEYGEFWYCPKCKKAYWRGSHFDKIMLTIQELEKGS